MRRADKRKLVNWQAKDVEDKDRINKRLETRTPLTEKAKNTEKPRFAPAQIQRGAPLLRIRKKIHEALDEDEDEDDEVYTPFFNIRLLDDNELERQASEKELETIKITKQQQMAGKLNIIMNTAMAAERAGLDSQMTAEDARLANSAEFDVKKMRRDLVRKKIEKPAGINGEISEKDLPGATRAINKALRDLSDDSLEDFPADSLTELDQTQNEEDLAKLILKKSGRKYPKKTLAEIAKRYTQNQQQRENSRTNQGNEQ